MGRAGGALRSDRRHVRHGAASRVEGDKLSRIFLLGATGAIGQATARALLARGHDVVCFIRPRSNGEVTFEAFDGAEIRFGEAVDLDALARDGFKGEAFDAVISCMASRTGAPKDAWRVDYEAHTNVLSVAKDVGVRHFVLLSAICVQKPRLAFQQAKLAFEKELIASGLDYSIVQPTAFFKSLSGQVDRVMAGKSFLVFGDGRGTSVKPISDGDLANYIVDCLDDPLLRNRILPIGGPGPALTPREQGERLFELAGKPPRFTQVPLGFLDGVIGLLSTLGVVIPPLKDKAELARIGRYYASESMLVWDAETDRYDAEATPSTGTETLFDFYRALIAGETSVERGAHKVF